MYDDDPVQVYLREVRNVPRMMPVREAECIQHIRAKDEHADVAAKDLLEANLALVVEIAQKHPSLHILDLIQAGNSALFSSLRAFADSDAEDFSSFAAPFVENAIVHAITSPSR